MHSLTLKLTLAFLVVGLIGAILVAVFVGQQTQREFDKFVLDSYQTDMVDSLAAVYKERGSWDDIDAIVVRMPWRRRGPEFARVPVTLVDADGVVVYGGKRFKMGQRLADNELKRAIPVEVDGRTVGRLLFAPPDRAAIQRAAPEATFLSSVNRAIRMSALAAIFVALILGLLLARGITRPIRKLTAATQAVARGQLGLKVDVSNKDEIGELAASFNQMSTDLARGSELRRQMTADIAHDLRTPLSVILGYTEALADGKLQGTPEMYGIMHDEARHLQHLIDDLRTLSLADAGELSLQRQPTMPKAPLERTAAAHASQAKRQDIELRIEATDDLPLILVDRDRMAQVLNNLVSNALRFTPEGGEVILAARADAENVYLEVKDNGVGIPKNELANVFERFYRVDEARTVEEGESGLGLAIAKSLTEAHGGAISVESEEGVGTTFVVALPRDKTG